jgi:hypothetical protein
MKLLIMQFSPNSRHFIIYPPKRAYSQKDQIKKGERRRACRKENCIQSFGRKTGRTWTKQAWAYIGGLY